MGDDSSEVGNKERALPLGTFRHRQCFGAHDALNAALEAMEQQEKVSAEALPVTFPRKRSLVMFPLKRSSVGFSLKRPRVTFPLKRRPRRFRGNVRP
jgi:hypothetical protein